VRIAIISDIHSNLEALQAVLENIKEKDVEKIFCLGDVVGYGADPNECVALVRKHCETTLLGNHDNAAVDLSLTKSFTTNARIAAEWTSKNLSGESRQFLRSLPFSSKLLDVMFVHSSPFQPEEWHYVLSVIDVVPALRSFAEPICFIGHTHVPLIYSEVGRVGRIRKGTKALVNVGSVGQPRDGNPRASYGVFDTKMWEYENARVEYDIDQAAGKIMDAGLPRALADRLFLGV
jgi:putative phosphoesterase